MYDGDLPRGININLDVPIDLVAMDQGLFTRYHFNFANKIVQTFYWSEDSDGSKVYNWGGVFVVQEIEGGLAMFDGGWRILPNSVQQRYAGYIAEKEILDGNDV